MFAKQNWKVYYFLLSEATLPVYIIVNLFPFTENGYVSDSSINNRCAITLHEWFSYLRLPFFHQS